MRLLRLGVYPAHLLCGAPRNDREILGLLEILRFLAIIGLVFLVIPLYARENIEKKESLTQTNSILTAPLRTGGNNLFHSLILIPPLESAERIETGQGYLQSGIDYASGNLVKERGVWLFDYNARLTEAFIDLRYGFSDRIELKASLTGAKLSEDKRDLLLFKGNFGYLQGQRGAGLSDLLLGVKFRLTESLGAEEEIPYTSALGIWYKKPLAQEENLLSSGGTDWAIAYIETDQLDEETFVHTQIGYTFTGDEDVFKEDVKISNTLFYGMGITWQCFNELALIGQIQGNTNAFKAIKALTQYPLSVQGGFRYSANKRFFTEGSIGFGLNKESAGLTMMFSMGTMF